MALALVHPLPRMEQLMTESEVIAVHKDVFYKALLTQDYTALAKLYLDDYVLVRPNGSVLSKQQVLRDLRETGLQFTAIDLKAEKARIYGTTAIITGESRTEFVRGGKAGYGSILPDRHLHSDFKRP